MTTPDDTLTPSDQPPAPFLDASGTPRDPDRRKEMPKDAELRSRSQTHTHTATAEEARDFLAASKGKGGELSSEAAFARRVLALEEEVGRLRGALIDLQLGVRSAGRTVQRQETRNVLHEIDVQIGFMLADSRAALAAASAGGDGERGVGG